MCVHESTQWYSGFDHKKILYNDVHITKSTLVFRFLCLLLASILTCSTLSVFAQAEFVGSKDCTSCY